MMRITPRYKVCEIMSPGELLGEGKYIIKIDITKDDENVLIEFHTNNNDILPASVYLDNNTVKELIRYIDPDTK